MLVLFLMLLVSAMGYQDNTFVRRVEIKQLLNEVINQYGAIPGVATQRKIERVASLLETTPSNELNAYPSTKDIRLLGDWQLLYSNRNSFRIPSVSNSSPINVIQRITSTSKVDHILEFADNPLICRITLSHDAKVTSEKTPAQMAIYLKRITVDGAILNNQKIPVLSSRFQSGSFDTTYLDGEIRISRGLFGELRVFKKL